MAQNSVESLDESCCYVKLSYIQTTCYFVFESVNVYVAVNERDCLMWQIQSISGENDRFFRTCLL